MPVSKLKVCMQEKFLFRLYIGLMSFGVPIAVAMSIYSCCNPM